MDTQPKHSIASLGYGEFRARMVTSSSVSKFLEYSKNSSGADPHLLCYPQSTDSATSACPCASYSLSICSSSGSHSFILFSLLYLHFLQRLPITYVSLSELLPASWPYLSPPPPAYFECGLEAPAICALAVATSVCRESQQMSYNAV